MSKKIGLCCCYKQRNYGSQLQSYATTVEMRNRGIDCEVIQYKKKFTPKFMREAKIWTLFFNRILISERILRYKKRFILMFHKDVKRQNDIRNAKLAQFSKERFTNLSKLCVGHDELEALGASYDGVFVGSDQLWSPGGITGNFHNLMFVPDNVPKFSYAASFGVSQIPKGKQKLYKTFLNRLDYISVRENAGQKIVKELTGRDAQVVADPVMLLTREQWDDEIEFKRMYDEPYIFAYFLGKSEENRRQANKLAKLTGLKIVTVHHMDTYNKADVDFGDYAPFEVGPEEFLNLIRGAEYVCTDSFHGSVFSMIYHKKLMIFKRYADASKTSKNSRIYSICENLGVTHRMFDGSNLETITEEIDYESVDSRIEKMRSESKAYLDKALAFYTE